MKRLAALSFLLAWTVTATAAEPDQLAWTLDYGDPGEWRGAIAALTERKKGIPGLAVASVLRRESVLTEKERLRLVRALGRRSLTSDPRVLAYLESQVQGGSEALTEAALEGLLEAYNPDVVPILAGLMHTLTERREKIAKRLISLYRNHVKADFERLGGGSLYPQDAARLARGGRSEPVYWPIFRYLTADADPALRYLAADHLRYFADRRGDELLWKLARDDDAEVAQKALWSLARRRDGDACEVLIDKFWASRGSGSGDVTGKRHRDDLADTGEVCGPTHLFELFTRVQDAGPARREEAEALLGGLAGGQLLPLLDDPRFRAGVASYRDADDPVVKHSAEWLLRRHDEERRERLLKDRPFWLGPATLVAFALISGLLGLVLFLWGFRLVQLLRLLSRLAPSRVRAAAVGTNLLRGRLEPAASGSLEHPATGEPCLYYAGADRARPAQRFYLVDDSGRILVDPRGAVLLSTDGMLEEGEAVQILGTISRARKPEGAPGELVIGKDAPRRTLVGRVGHFLVQGVLGLWDRSGTGRALFSDPRRCFWIWDDLDDKPPHWRGELTRLLLVFLLAGVWITVFAVAALAVFDAQFSETLALWLGPA